MSFLNGLNPVLQALLATGFTYGVTALGAAIVFLFKRVNRKILDIMLGFGAGVMIAASFWSLLSPAISMSEKLYQTGWFIPAAGFFVGGIFIISGDRLLNKCSFDDLADYQEHKAHHEPGSLKRCILLVTAITLHNIPEGMAVGVAFGGAASMLTGSDSLGAVLLAVGIGLQNFPEGASVSLPLRREGYSRRKSFFYGQLSGMVEPVAGVIGALAAFTMESILPFLLAFSAGAMIAVCASELIPESSKSNKNLATFGITVGFLVMMVMDVALG